MVDSWRRLGARRQAIRVTLALGFAVAAIVASCVAPVNAAAGAVSSFGGTAAIAPASTFAADAGYSAAYVAAATDVHPAVGQLSVELTFVDPLGAAAYGAAVRYFDGAGVQVTSSARNTATLTVGGSAAAIGAAFSTDLEAGDYNGTSVQFPATPPSLPSSLESEVAGVVGLSNGFTQFSFQLATIPGADASPDDANTVTPDLARQFYGLATLYDLGGVETYPTSLSIAVVLWGNGPSPSDLSAFFNDSSLYPSSLPKPTLHAYPVAGAREPSKNALDEANALAVEELTLDTEWAASMAPGATIDIVYAPNGPAPSFSPSTTALTAAVQKAVSLDPAVISMSFGAPESSASDLISAWTPLFDAAQANNTTIVAATGDSGGYASLSGSTCSGGPTPEFPSTDPQVLAVGGTNVSVHLGTGTGYSETAWSGSGGGYSRSFSAPSWQSSTVAVVRSNGHRGIPDVSATAADDFVLFNGTSQMARGTSFATPLWAGLVADIDAKWGHRLGFFTPSLYHIGSVEGSGGIGAGLADITSGSNCIGSATAGWDPVTGWGSPHAPVLYDDLLGSFVSIDLHLAHTTMGPGGTLAVWAQVTNRTSGAPIADLPVNLSISADTDLGPCDGGNGGVFETALPATNAQGWVYGNLSVPACYLGQHALVNATVATPKYYGTSGARVGVNLLGFLPELAFLQNPPYVYVTYAVIVGSACVVGAWIGRPRDDARRRGPTVGPVPGAGPSPTVVPPSPPPPPSAPMPAAPAPPPAPADAGPAPSPGDPAGPPAGPT